MKIFKFLLINSVPTFAFPGFENGRWNFMGSIEAGVCDGVMCEPCTIWYDFDGFGNRHMNSNCPSGYAQAHDHFYFSLCCTKVTYT